MESPDGFKTLPAESMSYFVLWGLFQVANLPSIRQ